ncbi:unnamed protein product [Acanthoscelides obtectus]|uniref:Uncharacterized protein n=1 Tax=Acanthoscelides obtectus TaxID=200917 RepID=A0A9P0PWH8_ACAOB|nr:unnamed protein product [Acanthoscelides obtectus]CAK1629849.1 hypothetical protein AOBTE_LOCUS5997 [Acanthoscelides obtectus]
MAIDSFEKCIVDVRNKIHDIINEAKSTEPQGNKMRRRNNSNHYHRVAALEVWDNIISIQRSFGSRIPFFSPNILENTVVSFLITSWKLPAWHIPN